MNSLLLRAGASRGVTGMSSRMTVSGSYMRAQVPTRSFNSGRPYHAEKKQSKMSKLTKVIKAQNAMLDNINYRVIALENRLSKKTGITSVVNLDQGRGSVSTESRVSAIVPKRIRILGKSFSASKIAGVKYRHSFMWLAFPYVVEMNYQKRTTEFLFGGEHFKIPITSDYEEHKFKCKDSTSAIQLVEDIIRECPHLRTSKLFT